MKHSSLKKFALAVLVGGTVLQFGGCLGGIGRLFLKSVVVGAGEGVGAIPAGIISGFITPLLPGTGTTTP